MNNCSTLVFRRAKVPGSYLVDLSLSSNAVNEEVELQLYPASGFSVWVIGNNLTFLNYTL
jgi:hypothetical protein